MFRDHRGGKPQENVEPSSAVTVLHRFVLKRCDLLASSLVYEQNPGQFRSAPRHYGNLNHASARLTCTSAFGPSRKTRRAGSWNVPYRACKRTHAEFGPARQTLSQVCSWRNKSAGFKPVQVARVPYWLL